MAQGLMLAVVIFGSLFGAGFLLGIMVADQRASKHSVKGTFSVEELEDAPGYGKIHIDFNGCVDKDADKIILYRTDSPE